MSFQPSFFAGPRHSVANRVPVQPSHVRPGSGAAQITLLGAALTTPGSPRHACITAGLRAVIGGQGQCLAAQREPARDCPVCISIHDVWLEQRTLSPLRERIRAAQSWLQRSARAE